VLLKTDSVQHTEKTVVPTNGISTMTKIPLRLQTDHSLFIFKTKS